MVALASDMLCGLPKPRDRIFASSIFICFPLRNRGGQAGMASILADNAVARSACTKMPQPVKLRPSTIKFVVNALEILVLRRCISIAPLNIPTDGIAAEINGLNARRGFTVDEEG